MGPVLDLAVIALSALVCVALAMLAWTLGVAGVRAVREERMRVSAARATLTSVDRLLPERAAAVRRILARLSTTIKGDR